MEPAMNQPDHKPIMIFGPWGSSINTGDNPTGSEIYGGKGYNNAKMASMDLPVPDGLVIPTSYCAEYMTLTTEDDRAFYVAELYETHVAPQIELIRVSNTNTPLAFSVRSGARVSMPGMMETILNAGVESWFEWGKTFGFQNVEPCESRFKSMYRSVVGAEPTLDAGHQIENCIRAVFDSWNCERATVYRDLHNIPHTWGTAVVIQKMVFGNLDDESCTGVLFSHDPATGQHVLTGEFLPNAQGEDVVSGEVTPYPLADLSAWNPVCFETLRSMTEKLTNTFNDMVEIEFTVERNVLYILQVRVAKRTPRASFRVAADRVAEGLWTLDMVGEKVSRTHYMQLAETTVSEAAPAPHGTGIAAGGTVAQGIAALSSEKAQELAAAGHTVILITEETTPSDFPGMVKSAGILTGRGGLTCHAAVVGRAEGKTCVVGCSDLTYEKGSEQCLINGTWVQEGLTVVTIDGTTGNVWVGAVPLNAPEVPEEAVALLVDLAAHKKVTIESGTEVDFLHAHLSGRLTHAGHSHYVNPTALTVLLVLEGLDPLVDLTDDWFLTMTGDDGRDREQDVVDALLTFAADHPFTDFKVSVRDQHMVDYVTSRVTTQGGNNLTMVTTATSMEEWIAGYPVTQDWLFQNVGSDNTIEAVKSALNINDNQPNTVATLTAFAQEYLA
jgi:phosphoenolpyruvate synthase/pyruvate phosphate dikinase